MFQDRTDAGRQLADLLEKEDVEADIVLGIPRGGLPVTHPVADRLNSPLDIVVASKIGAQRNTELVIGAVASDGTSWLNHDLIEELTIPDEYIERKRGQEAENARQKINRYRRDRDPSELGGNQVVIVDDGVATGATARACLRQVREAGAERVILAVPVGSPDTIEELQLDADEVIAIETPPHFRAVGQFYERFEQISDEEAVKYLERE